MQRPLWCPLAATCLILAAGFAQAEPTEPTGRTVMSLGDLEPTGYWAAGDRVAVTGAGFDEAWRVRTRQKPGKPWGVMLKGGFAEGVPAGHLVWVAFDARSAVEAGSPPVAEAQVKAQGGALTRRFRVGGAWHRHGFAFRPGKPIVAGEATLEFFLGYRAQVIEIGGLRVVDLGPDADADALPVYEPWRDDPREGRAPAAPSRFRASLLADELASLPEPRFLVGETVESARERYTHTAAHVAYRIVPADRPAYGEAVELRVFNRPRRDFRAQYTAKLAAPVRAGDAILIAFDARATASEDATGHGLGEFHLSLAGPPYAKSFSHPVTFEHAWQRYFLRGVAKRDYAPGEAKVELWLGKRRQTIEIAGLSVMNFGGSVDVVDLPTQDLGLDYPGREPGAAWRAEARERIERLRKAPLTVEVVDAEGGPVEGAAVRFEQRRHAFVFGTTLDSRKLVPSRNTPAEIARHEALLTGGMFNVLVPANEFKWRAWAGAFGPFYRPEQADWAVRWAEARGLTVKGHVLVWNLPAKVKRAVDDDPSAVQSAVRERIVETAGRYGRRIAIWDVINENYKHDSVTSVVGDDAVIDWFKWAKESSGGAKLFWNEIHVLPDTERGAAARAHTHARVANLIEKGAPIDGIGVQGHLGIRGAPPPEVVLQRFDDLARHGLEIHVTEFDVNIRDRGDPAQVAFQADYVRDFLTAAFSHPAVTGVIYWTPFPFKWLPDTALADEDFALRPHGEAWRELVTKAWWTDDRATTDDAGGASVRGFLGAYAITVEHGEKAATAEATLDADGETVRVTLR